MKQALRYASKGLLALTLSVGLVVAGCTFAGAMAKLKQYVPIGLQAFAGIIAIVNPPAGSALALAAPLVNKAWSDITATVDAYEAADANNKAGKLGEVLAALDAIQANLKQTISDLGGNASSTEAQAAQAAILLISTTLGAIEAQLAPQAAATVQITHTAHAKVASIPQSVRVGATPVYVTPAKSPSDFKAQYTKIMVAAGHPERKL